MTRDEIIQKAAEVGITLTAGDIKLLDGHLTIDGMDPYEWLDGMTMD